MLRKVRITEKDSNNIIAELPINLETDDASDEDYLDEAWEDALDDGLVDTDNKSDYRIEFVEDISEE